MKSVARSTALATSLLISRYQAAVTTGDYSEPNTITWEDANEGKVEYTYKTYLEGETGLQVPWLEAEIKITDKKTGVLVPSSDFGPDQSCSKSAPCWVDPHPLWT